MQAPSLAKSWPFSHTKSTPSLKKSSLHYVGVVNTTKGTTSVFTSLCVLNNSDGMITDPFLFRNQAQNHLEMLTSRGFKGYLKVGSELQNTLRWAIAKVRKMRTAPSQGSALACLALSIGMTWRTVTEATDCFGDGVIVVVRWGSTFCRSSDRRVVEMVWGCQGCCLDPGCTSIPASGPQTSTKGTKQRAAI